MPLPLSAPLAALFVIVELRMVAALPATRMPPPLPLSADELPEIVEFTTFSAVPPKLMPPADTPLPAEALLPEIVEFTTFKVPWVKT